MSEKCELCGGEVTWTIVSPESTVACYECSMKAVDFYTPENRALVERVKSGDFGRAVAGKVADQYPRVDCLRIIVFREIEAEANGNGGAA